MKIEKAQNFTLQQIIDGGESTFIFNKEYQRSFVWGKERRQALIDSIIKDYSIGTLILRQTRDGKYEVLDGQQRLKTIFEFVKSEKLKTSPKLTPEFPDKSYDELKRNSRRISEFNSFKVSYELVYGGSDEEIANIFLKLQEGLPLNAAEKLNAMLGKMRNFIFSIVQSPFFSSGIDIDFTRFSHRYLAAQITLLELDTEFKYQQIIFPDIRFTKLRKMYEDYRTNIRRGLQKRVKANLDFLHNSLRDDAKVIHTKSDVPLVYILVSYTRRKYDLIEKSNEFKTFLINFFIKVDQAEVIPGRTPRSVYGRYKELRKKGLTPDNFKTRFDLLLNSLLEKVHGLRLKDRKESFDDEQKVIIYYKKCKKKCDSCGREVKWDDASYHHVIFHSKGGPTSVKNGALMHKKCHDEFHKRKGKDESY